MEKKFFQNRQNMEQSAYVSNSTLTLASHSINKIYFSTMLSVNGNAKSLGGPVKKSRLAERLQFIRNFVVFPLTSSKIEFRKF